MITLTKEIRLSEEKRPLIVALNKENSIFKELSKLLNNGLVELNEKMVIPTLNLIKSPKVYLFKGENLEDDFAEIAALKGDYVVLLDTFVNKLSVREVYKLFGQIIFAEANSLNLKSEKKDESKSFTVYSTLSGEEGLVEGKIIGESIDFAKKLVDLPNNYLNADKMARCAIEKCHGLENVEITILNKQDLEELKMGAFLAVNKGSYDEPRLIAIKYQGKEKWEDPLCIIGKGLTFDTGGYTLKSSMIGMKGDMAGGAAVLGAAFAIATLKLKENVLFLVGATDNRLGEYAIVPDDILTSMSGKTIEVVSTDAEGRLVLVDVITYAQKLGAKKIIDVATLTGSMAATFGGNYTGAYSNDQQFFDHFKKASERAYEHIWQMPLDDRFFENIKSKIADMKNSGGKSGGASSAAIFIKQFINEGTKWIHLDIAGTSSKNDSATGVMVKSFVEICKE